MPTVASQFYFTKLDKDYSVKGSRDPLGFQVLWQHQARKLIPYLSTVSSSIKDFQIMALAYYLYDRPIDGNFVRFFIRFEQLMAFVRLQSGEGGFNGVERVKKRMPDGDQEKISISNKSEDEILSNQRSYGIWGKYNRPFQDIEFIKDPRFLEVYALKINTIKDKASIIKIIRSLIEKDRITIAKEQLILLQPLLQLTNEEKTFYTQKVLKLDGANSYQNNLFDYLTRHPQPDEAQFNFYGFLKNFQTSSSADDQTLQFILTEIEATEKILAPLNRIFRYLQTQPLWSKDALIKNSFITDCKQINTYLFPTNHEENKIKNTLSSILQLDNWKLVEQLAGRNSEVTSWRGGRPWLTVTNNLLEIHYSDGGYHDPNFNTQQHADNHYFFDTYINLFSQLN